MPQERARFGTGTPARSASGGDERGRLRVSREVARLALNRRRFLVGAGATIAGAVGAAPRSPAAEPFHITQGRFAIAVISDGHLVLPTSFLAPQIPSPEREAALQSSERGQGQYASPTNITLIRTGAELILVDAGSGSHFM